MTRTAASGFSLSNRRRAAASRIARSSALALLGVRAGARWIGAHAGSRAARSRRKEQAMLRTAEDVTALMGNMKGVTMKLGQIMSVMTGTVPPDFADSLATLQSRATPMAPGLVKQVFEEEFGKSPDRIFRRFNWQPFAAASIGQVHRAELQDGSQVAVKVQYPGAAEAVTADLANVGLLFNMAGFAARGLDPGPLVRDLKTGILGELDYRRELASQARFAALFRDHPFVKVPDVLPAFSSSRVLVQEHVEGQPFATARSWDQDRKNALAEKIFRFTFGTMHRHGLFQADPHAGNYLLMADGRVAFIDYGCVVEFAPALREQLNRMIAGVILGDLDQWRAGMVEVGYVPPDLDLETAELWEHMRLYYSFIVEDGVRFTPELAASMVRQNLQLSGETGRVNRKLNIPQGVVFTQRINFGFAGLMASLEASGPWHSIIREYTLGEGPATALGRASASHTPRMWV